MSQENRKPIDQILDLLIDAIQERQNDRINTQEPETKETIQTQQVISADIPETTAVAIEENNDESDLTSINDSYSGNLNLQSETEIDHSLIENENIDEEGFSEFEWLPPEKLPSINMNRIFYRLSIAVALIIVLINIPFNRYGTNLARAMPDEKALIVRDGLIFTGPGDEVYILEDNKKRWISSLTAFELSGYDWSQVHEVEQGFVDQFEDGPDHHAIIRCSDQPHIYLLEGAEKRWIENPVEFEKAGFKWDDVRYINCFDLKNKYPDGVPIPADAGDPPSW